MRVMLSWAASFRLKNTGGLQCGCRQAALSFDALRWCVRWLCYWERDVAGRRNVRGSGTGVSHSYKSLNALMSEFWLWRDLGWWCSIWNMWGYITVTWVCLRCFGWRRDCFASHVARKWWVMCFVYGAFWGCWYGRVQKNRMCRIVWFILQGVSLLLYEYIWPCIYIYICIPHEANGQPFYRRVARSLRVVESNLKREGRMVYSSIFVILV